MLPAFKVDDITCVELVEIAFQPKQFFILLIGRVEYKYGLFVLFMLIDGRALYVDYFCLPRYLGPFIQILFKTEIPQVGQVSQHKNGPDNQHRYHYDYTAACKQAVIGMIGTPQRNIFLKLFIRPPLHYLSKKVAGADFFYFLEGQINPSYERTTPLF